MISNIQEIIRNSNEISQVDRKKLPTESKVLLKHDSNLNEHENGLLGRKVSLKDYNT